MTRRALWLTLSLLAIALAASASGLGNGFVFDDRPIVVDNFRVHTLVGLWHSFAEPYWPPEVGAALYRPVTIVLFRLEWALGGGSPWAFHAANVLLYLAIVFAVFRLARLILPLPAAWLTAALFAVQPVHVEAVANTVGQPELVVGLLAVSATAWYVAARRGEELSWLTVGGLAAIYLVMCFTKEHGIVLPGLLIAAEFTLLERPRPARSGALLAALVVVAVLFIVVRTAVLGGLAGDIANASIRGVGLEDRVLTMLAIVPQWIRLLLLPWHLQADYMPRELELATTFGLAQLIGSLLLTGLVALTVWSRKRAPVVCFGLCWTGIALFPVSNLAIPTGILLAERALFLASVGSALSLGGGLAAAIPKFVAAPVGERRVVLLALGILLGVGLYRSATRQRIWRDNDTLFRQTVLDAPLSYKAHWAYGSVLIAAGDMKQADLEYRLAMRLYDGDPNLFSDFGDVYVRARHCAPAIPLYQRSLSLAPDQWKVRSKLVLCYLDQGNASEARSEAEQKAIRKDPDAARIQAVVDSLTAAAVQFPPPKTGPKN